jgi:glucokinase
MTTHHGIYIGTDSGATTSKTGGVWADGTIISTKLRQSSTNSQAGTSAVIRGWVDGVTGFLTDNKLNWDQVLGAGLAIPGPFESYGILGRAANLPKTFEGWNFHAEYSAALAAAAGRPIPLVCGNDGNYGGVGEALRVRGSSRATVLMLAPGSGLGVAYVDANGLPLEGDTLNGMEGGHMPAVLQMLGGIKPLKCGCGRDWGCIEPYTTISGLPQMLEEFLPKHPTHAFHSSPAPIKEKAFSLRTLAQKGDPLAVEIFDFQAKALGLHMASLLAAVDAEYVVIGGGLIDPEATTPEFRERYLRIIHESALPYLWPQQRQKLKVVPATLGELSQAIGAALVALNTVKAQD